MYNFIIQEYVMFPVPKVSIIIPVYNREKIISETLDCALTQNYDDYEVIVCDNKSTDKTWEILLSYAEKYLNLKVYQNKENIGPVRNWNACLEKASGEYLKILWSDDLISKDYLSKTVPILELNQEIGFVYTATSIFTDEQESIAYQYGFTGRYHSKDFIRKQLFNYNDNMPVSPGNALFRTKDVKKNLILDIENPKKLDFARYGAGNDLLIFLLAANEYKYFYYVDEKLSFFRNHSDSITIKVNLLEYYIYSKIFFVKEYNKTLNKNEVDKYYTYIKLELKQFNYMLSDINYKFRLPIKFILGIIFNKIVHKLTKH